MHCLCSCLHVRVIFAGCKGMQKSCGMTLQAGRLRSAVMLALHMSKIRSIPPCICITTFQLCPHLWDDVILHGNAETVRHMPVAVLREWLVAHARGTKAILLHKGAGGLTEPGDGKAERNSRAQQVELCDNWQCRCCGCLAQTTVRTVAVATHQSTLLLCLYKHTM